MNESESENLEHIGHAMMLAWTRVKKAQARMWGEWMTIGEGLLEGRRWAMNRAGTNRPEGKGFVMAYSEWLKRYKVDDMDKSDRAKLLQLMEERPGVEEWRATLTDYDRRNLNNPTIVWRKWTAATRVKKPKSRTEGVSATEHGRARTMIEQLQARTDELEQESHSAWVDALKGRSDQDRAEALYQLLLEFDLSLSHLNAAHEAYRAKAATERTKASDPEPAAPTDNSTLTWTGNEEDGFLGQGLVEGQHPIAYTVTFARRKGAFEAKVITDPDPDLTLPVEQLADRYGFPLTGDDKRKKGQRRKVDPVATPEEAKALCEAAYAQQ